MRRSAGEERKRRIAPGVGNRVPRQHGRTYRHVRPNGYRYVNRWCHRAGGGSGHATVIDDHEMVVSSVRPLDMRVIVVVVRLVGERNAGGQHDGGRRRDGG